MSICCRPATTPARPARISRPGSSWRRRASTAQAWETLVRDNPMPAVHGRVCYHPCETACNRGELDAPVEHPRRRALSRRSRGQEGWPFRVEGGAERQARAGRRRRAERAVGRLSSRAARPHGRDPRGRAAAGRHDAFRHSGLPPAARGSDAGDRAHRGHGRQDRHQPQGRGRAGRKDGREASTRSSSPSAPASAKHVDIPARDAVRVLDAVSLLHDVNTGEAPRLGRRVVVYGGGNTAMDAARTAKRLGADEALIVYRRDRAHMPAHAFEADEAIEEGVKIKWLTTHQGDRRPRSHGRDDGARCAGPAAAHRAIRDAEGRRDRAGARPGNRQRAFCAGCRASNSRRTAR